MFIIIERILNVFNNLRKYKSMCKKNDKGKVET